MQIKSNALVKFIVPAVVIAGLAVGLKSCKNEPAEQPQAKQSGSLKNLSPDELKALGVEGDTPEDTLRTLIGRLPINGTVTDPYPFKVLIGKDNLTANGIELPDVEGAIVSGTASGDWTLSCVRGQVNSVTFVFSDGTVRTLPRPDTSNNAGGQNNNAQAKQDTGTSGGIGWISDENGIPCIGGERKSNASTYLMLWINGLDV